MEKICNRCKKLFNSRQALYKHQKHNCQKLCFDELIEKFPQLYSQQGGKYYCCDYEMTLFDSNFKHPTTIMVAAPTKAGKTTLVKKIVEHSSTLFTPPAEKIIWCYSEYQPNVYNLSNVEYIKGIPDIDKLRESKDIPKLLILDDMMTELKSDPNLLQLFTRGCHHWNCSVIHILQDLFYDRQRTNRINTQYLFLLKSPADQLTAMNLAKQMFPKQTLYFMNAYKQATSQPHGYLLVDLDQNTPEHLRLRTNIFPDETMLAWLPEINKKA